MVIFHFDAWILPFFRAENRHRGHRGTDLLLQIRPVQRRGAGRWTGRRGEGGAVGAFDGRLHG